MSGPPHGPCGLAGGRFVSLARMPNPFRMAWLLWRLAWRLTRDAGVGRAASFNVVMEGPAQHRERVRIAKANGEAEPPPYVAYEVTYWADVGKSAGTKVGGGGRGWQLQDALGEALK